ncbi:MAG: Crp/Fnr family transcriptional regulator [Bacteroidota bacterium]
MKEIRAYLEQLGGKVSPQLEARFSVFEAVKLAKGDYFLMQGDICKKMAFLTKGQIRHFYDVDGKEVTRWVSLDQNFVTSFASFVSGRPSLENLVCIEDCEMYLCSKEAFMQIKAEFPSMTQLWVLALEQEMVGYEYRVFQLISGSAENRYLDFLKEYPRFVKEVPQKYLASMLGIEPRSLSRIRKKIADGN